MFQVGVNDMYQVHSILFCCQAQPQQASSSRDEISFSLNFSSHPPPTQPTLTEKVLTVGNLANFRSHRWGSSLTVCARLTVRTA
jgi:hypothetical protein